MQVPATIEPPPPTSGAVGPASVAAIAATESVWRGPTLRRFWALNASHAVIDVFPIFVTSLMLVLENRLSLSAAQVGVLYMITPIFSGSLQPFFAWLTDKYDTRICAPFGLALGATCLCSIGLAQNFWQVVVLIMLGVIGTGMYHPTGAALAGQLGGRALRHGRAWALALFFAAGMVGQAIGPIVCTRINYLFGLEHLLWLVPPSLVVAVGLHLVVRRAGHRHDNHRELHAAIPPDEARARWWAVSLLMTQNCLRFIVNIGMLVMFNVWAASVITTDPARAANLSGNLAAAMTVGMGVTGLFVGRMVRPGREKSPLVSLSIVGAIFVAVSGAAGYAGVDMANGAWWALWPMYVVVALTALGYGATIPMSIALAQRLLPGRTGLASSLMMGLGWSVSALAPVIAPLFLGGVSIKEAPSLPHWRIDVAFVCFGALLLVAGALAAAMPGALLRKIADER